MGGKIFSSGTVIIEGWEAIKQHWILPDNVKILSHKITPSEITPSEITHLGDTAYDFGYYEGKTLAANGDTTSWKGKYVIIWEKTDDLWKVYLDIWNRDNN